MNELLNKILTRTLVATPGPWVWSRSNAGAASPPHFELFAPVVLGELNGLVMHGHPLNICKSDDEWQPTYADAEFIAHARADVPRLLAALDAVLSRHKWVEPFIDTTGTRYTLSCKECRQKWPCETVQSITEALEGTE